MADDHRLVDLQALQNRARVARHVVEVVGNDRLRRSAVADLIGHDHAESFLAQRVDRPAEVEAGEIVAVQQHDRVAVRLAERRHVHERDAHVLSVQRERQVGDGIRVRDVFAGDAAGLDVCWRRNGRRPLLREYLEGGETREDEDEDDKGEHCVPFRRARESAVASMALAERPPRVALRR